jgi:hypothetical protein
MLRGLKDSLQNLLVSFQKSSRTTLRRQLWPCRKHREATMAASNPSSKDERLARRGFGPLFGRKALLAGSQDARYAGFFGT